jgi:hypothetical protein
MIHGAAVFDNSSFQATKALKWPDRVVKVAISNSLLSPAAPIRSQSDVSTAVIKALQRWEAVANIEFELNSSEKTAISPGGMSGDGVSLITIGSDDENQLAFAKKLAGASAMTRVFHDARGSITEADIALNPSQLFSTDRTPGTFDLEAVVTHEVGHLLGLSHSKDPSAVMFDGVQRNKGVESSTNNWSLSSDDITRLRALYGANVIDAECCSSVVGNLGNLASGQSVVWIENLSDGSLIQVRDTGPRGVFEFSGLSNGRYRILAQSSGESSLFAAEDPVQTYSVADPRPISIHSSRTKAEFDLRFVGINGHLSNRAVFVSAGNTYRFTVAGPGLSRIDLKIVVTNPKIVFSTISDDQTETAKGFPTRVFDMYIDPLVRSGRYSIYAEDSSRNRRYFVGAIAVR